MTETDLGAIFEYLMQITPIENRVEKYSKYGKVSD
jgi:hypothetical protein